jgi:hypothetical protein
VFFCFLFFYRVLMSQTLREEPVKGTGSPVLFGYTLPWFGDLGKGGENLEEWQF